MATLHSISDIQPGQGHYFTTLDDLDAFIRWHFIDGQYIHLERWKVEDVGSHTGYTLMEGFVDDYNYRSLTVKVMETIDDNSTQREYVIPIFNIDDDMVAKYNGTGTLTVTDPHRPYTYQVIGRTPAVDGPHDTGCLINDKGQESPFDLTKLQQVWLDSEGNELPHRLHDDIEATTYRRTLLDGSGRTVGAVTSYDGGRTWQAQVKQGTRFIDVEGFNATESLADNANLAYIKAGGSGRWTKRTMIEVPLFEMAS